MNAAIRLDQPDLIRPAASRRLSFGAETLPAMGILNGHGTTFEGGADTPALSLKWLPQGAADYRSEGRAYRLTGSTQLLLDRGQPYRMAMRGQSESFVLFFPQQAADAAWEAHSGRSERVPEIPTVAAASPLPLQQLLEQLRTAAQATHPTGTRLHELCCAVLSQVMALAADRRGLATRIPALRPARREELLRRLLRAEAYLVESGAGATLSGAAAAAALSPFHLIRLFDAVFGNTPLAYAAARRLERACEALVHTRHSIAEIAQAVGYESRNAFDRAFVRRFGMTPGAARATKFAIPADAQRRRAL